MADTHTRTVGTRRDRETVAALLAADFPSLDLRLTDDPADLRSGVARVVVRPADELPGLLGAGVTGFAFPASEPAAGSALLFAEDDRELRAVRRFYLPPVILAGAGPGGVGTMTLAATRALANADVVFADCLCGDEVLTFLRPGATCVAVGKRGDGPSAKQEEIHRGLVAAALAGRRVVRLKGGDPCVFGRLEEEIGALAGPGLAYRVLPGVGAASAAAAFAGQPLTVREIASEVIFSTGRIAGGGRNPFPLRGGAAPSICLYMSRKVLPERMADLRDAGYPEDTPVLLLEKLGSAGARAVAGTVETIAGVADRAGVGTPAVVLVGAQYHAVDHLPLAGVRIWLPAERETAANQREPLEELGAVIHAEPLIEPVALPVDEGAVLSRPFDWVVFTSKRGVDFFFALLAKWGFDSRWLPKVAAIGEPTIEKLRARGVRPDLIPPEPTRVALSTSLLAKGIAGQRILLPMSAVAPDHLRTALAPEAAEVVRLDLYGLDFPRVPAVPDVDVVLFSSESTVRSARASGLLPEIARRGLLVGGIGPATWRRLEEEGLPVAIRPDGTSPAALARATHRRFANLSLAAGGGRA